MCVNRIENRRTHEITGIVVDTNRVLGSKIRVGRDGSCKSFVGNASDLVLEFGASFFQRAIRSSLVSKLAKTLRVWFPILVVLGVLVTSDVMNLMW